MVIIQTLPIFTHPNFLQEIPADHFSTFLHFYTGPSSPEVPCPVLPAIGQPISGNGEEARHLPRSAGALQTYRKRSKNGQKTWENDGKNDGNPDIICTFLLFSSFYGDIQ